MILPGMSVPDCHIAGRPEVFYCVVLVGLSALRIHARRCYERGPLAGNVSFSASSIFSSLIFCFGFLGARGISDSYPGGPPRFGGRKANVMQFFKVPETGRESAHYDC
jgi:hypothetical protein